MTLTSRTLTALLYPAVSGHQQHHVHLCNEQQLLLLAGPAQRSSILQFLVGASVLPRCLEECSVKIIVVVHFTIFLSDPDPIIVYPSQ